MTHEVRAVSLNFTDDLLAHILDKIMVANRPSGLAHTFNAPPYEGR